MNSHKFTWGDSVRIKLTASVDMRAGELGEVVAITEIDTQNKVDLYGVPLGSTVYQIEFGDGKAMEIKESCLESSESE